MNRFILVALCCAFGLLMASGCGGGGSDEGGGGGDACAAPTVDATGTWTITEQSTNNNCGDDIRDPYTLEVTQAGSNISVYSPSLNQTFTGEVCGNTLSWTGSYPEDGGTTTIDLMTAVITVDALSSTSSWRWSDGVDSCSGTTDSDGSLLVGAADIAAPSVPTGLTATALSDSEIICSWNAATDNVVVTGYNVYRDGSYLGALGGTSNADTPLTASTTYCYQVSAFDAAGNDSGLSVEACATTSDPGGMSYSFNGGTLADLEAASPTLVFDDLTINGVLEIPSSAVSVTLTVDNLYVNAMITVAYPACSPYGQAPDLIINASQTVVLDAPIEMIGKRGLNTTTGTVCNNCSGTNGGNVTINAADIDVNRYIHTWGGGGATDSWYVGTTLFRCGCEAGDGGDIHLNATNTLDIGPDGANQEMEGGSGGLGNTNCSNGPDGIDGILNWDGADIRVNEIAGDLNMYTYNAQLMDYGSLSLLGRVGLNEEFDHRNNNDAWYINLGNGSTDWLEDLYLLDVKIHSLITLSLTPQNANADLDLYLLSEDMATILAQSNGASGSESISGVFYAPGKYFVAVSYADDGLNLTTDYTLEFGQ